RDVVLVLRRWPWAILPFMRWSLVFVLYGRKEKAVWTNALGERKALVQLSFSIAHPRSFG
ncbi:hypothetical protein, partial [Anoxybacillus sp. LAT_11]|uniref:hypothetical protein n=1 Tax=Anoxybacillus sp. LAT_11 TaxID=2862718 RepID=UPI001EEA732D